MKELLQRTVGEIVAEDYRASIVFRKKGLDFCCGGKKTLNDACRAKQLEADQILEELKLIKETEKVEENYSKWDLDSLVNHIVQTHHNYVKSMLPELNFYAEKVSRVHGRTYPELVKIYELVQSLSEELTQHLEKEEQELFPWITDMVRNDSKKSINESLLNLLEFEHEKAGLLMQEIESLTNNFTPPEGACTSYRVFFKHLEDFQKDLHKHVHLENNVLFPRVLK